ncbi:MAG: tRNA glutamyl-Q(34) synthetase GluQRS [Pseudomonadota bacterium]
MATENLITAPTTPVFRFAPSPNGLMHLGHAYSAMLNLKMARDNNGKMLLRIEDIDTVRCTPENEKRMLEDLEWIGFEWDEEPMRQSSQFERYGSTISDLFDEAIAYPSTMSRREIAEAVEAMTANGKSWPTDPDGAPHYPGNERIMNAAERAEVMAGEHQYAMRLDLRTAGSMVASQLTWNESGAGPEGQSGEIIADPAIWGDVILGRKDIPASYHLSAVLDDALQGVTHIVRGRDIFHATSVHRLLQELLQLPAPDYHHHDLILDEDGRKLSKSRQSTALRHLREAGMTASDVNRMIGLG